MKNTAKIITAKLCTTRTGESDYLSADGEVSVAIGLAPDGGMLRPSAMGDFAPHPGQGPAAITNLPMPLLSFGLEKKRSLWHEATYFVPSSIMSPPGAGDGQSTTHPSADARIADCQTLTRALLDDLDRCIAAEGHSKGRFCQPFFVRYAMRLHDGTYAKPSPAVLMLPSMLPPMIGMRQIAADEESMIVAFDIQGISAYELRVKALQAIDERWKRHVAAIDIFVTSPIATYDRDHASLVGVTSYADILAMRNVGHADRGRDNGAASGMAYQGHWSDGNDAYADHYLDISQYGGMRVWDVAPNTSFADQLLHPGAYHLAASIPISEIKTEAYTAVPIDSTNPDTLAKRPVLAADNASHWQVAPDASCAIGDRVFGAGGSATPPSPIALSVLAGAYAPSQTETEVTVWAIHGGAKVATRQTFAPGMCPDLAGEFPLHIEHPNPQACLMAICQGDRQWLLPLTTCDNGEAAHWVGKIGSGEPPEQCGADAIESLWAEAERTIGTPNRVYATSATNSLWYSHSATVGHGRVLALHTALKAMSQGQFGQYPLYAFATDGVWALAIGTDGTFARQRISGDNCLSLNAITPVDGGVAYASPRGIMCVSGSTIECLSDTCPRLSVPQLPKWQEFAALAGFSGALTPIEQALGDCTLAYDYSRRTLIVDCPGLDYAFAYSFASRQWGMPLKHDGEAIVVTRPLKLGEPERLKSVNALAWCGRLNPGASKCALWASDDMDHWSLVASAPSSRLNSVQGTPRKYYVAAIAIALEPGHWLSAISAQWQLRHSRRLRLSLK